MTISLPHAMIREVDQVRKQEHRTRSELIREALRTYFAVGRILPIYTPTSSELRAVEKGRAEIRRGEYCTLDELRASLESCPRKTRQKTYRSSITS